MENNRNIGIIIDGRFTNIYIQKDKYSPFLWVCAFQHYTGYWIKDRAKLTTTHALNSLSIGAWTTRERRVKTYSIYRITENELYEKYPGFLVDALL